MLFPQISTGAIPTDSTKSPLYYNIYRTSQFLFSINPNLLQYNPRFPHSSNPNSFRMIQFHAGACLQYSTFDALSNEPLLVFFWQHRLSSESKSHFQIFQVPLKKIHRFFESLRLRWYWNLQYNSPYEKHGQTNPMSLGRLVVEIRYLYISP